MSKRSKRGKAGPKDEEPTAAEPQVPPQEPEQAGETEALRTERDDLLARLQRVSADYLNYQKRVQRDIAQAREYANEELIRALLSVLDDMERALDAARANHEEADPLLQGMQLVHDKALETLGKFGVARIDAEGQPFDPDRHSAMMQEASDDHPPQTVLRELQRGYQLKGRTIRPSAVVVSRRPDELEDTQSKEAAEENQEMNGDS